MRIFLNFKNDNMGLVEITEPIGFDGSTFTVMQDSGRYGRDISFGSEEISLQFVDGVFENGLTMCLSELLDYYKTYGFESEVEFIIQDFTTGVLDFQNAKTDLLTYFECKIIQENERAIIKRREEINIDVFSNKDLDGNTITPLSTENILLKAKPIKQFSEWTSNGASPPSYGPRAINTAMNSKTYGIKSSLVPFKYYDGNFGAAINNFRYIYAKTQLTDLKFTIDVDIDLHSETNLGTSGNIFGTEIYLVEYNYPYDPYDSETEIHLLYTKFLYGAETQDFNINESLIFNLATLNIGKSIAIFALNTWDTEHMDYSYRVVNSMNIKAEATSTAMNSVIKGVRYADLFTQNIKSISGLSTTNKIDVNQFAFNGKLIRQFSDKPFYVNFKDLVSDLAETNKDYQINKTNVFIGEYSDFYKNTDLGGFLQSATSDFNSTFNQRYTINQFDYNYKTFEQNKDESNTNDSVHTQAQFLLPNKLVENTKKVEVSLIRDPFSIEASRRQGINTKESTSLENDDKLFVIDIVEVESGQLDSFNAELLIRVVDGKVNILNNNLASDYDPFNWKLLGFTTFSSFEILQGENVGSYTIDSIEESIITLTPIGFTPTFTGDAFLKIQYSLDGVTYTNRTNEGFTKIENLVSGDNFSNLRYSIKRNLKYWSSYLKTAMKFNNGTIKNTFFKNNNLLTTRYGTETIDLVEGGEIATFDDAILSPIVYKTVVVADFDMVKKLLEDLSSKMGFVRIVDTNDRVVKVHPTKLTYSWATNELEIEGESRNESDYLKIDSLGDLIRINEVGYDKIILKNKWFKIDGFFLYLYDLNGVLLANKTRYNKVQINGVVPTSEINLADLLYGL